MTTTQVPRPSERYERNIVRHHDSPCYLCGKALRTSQYRVNVLATSEDHATLLPIDRDGSPIDGSAGEGTFVIGSECAKSIPSGFKAKRPNSTGD